MRERFSLRARVASFRYAFAGLRTMLATQHNARVHLAATVLVTGLGFALGLSAADWKWLVATITVVWFAEAMNSAFEYLCDVVSPQHDEAVRHAKDIAAGAVLLCAMGAVVMAGLIFGPYLYRTFG